jgi:GDPmannose 4,6-dehydratase
MWRMLQQSTAEDFVVATGRTHSVEDFVEAATRHLGMDLQWSGDGVDQVGTDRKSGRVVVRVDPQFFRPAEVDTLTGDAGKAAAKLGWQPSTTFEQLVTMMVDADLARERRGSAD